MVATTICLPRTERPRRAQPGGSGSRFGVGASARGPPVVFPGAGGGPSLSSRGAGMFRSGVVPQEARARRRTGSDVRKSRGIGLPLRSAGAGDRGDIWAVRRGVGARTRKKCGHRAGIAPADRAETARELVSESAGDRGLGCAWLGGRGRLAEAHELLADDLAVLDGVDA